MKKILSSKGESLVETLFALLIAVLGLTLLAGAIVSSAKVNSRIKDISVMKSDKDEKINQITVSIKESSGIEKPVTWSEADGLTGYYQENGGLYYYEVGRGD